MTCSLPHTKFQPPEWCCPICGGDNRVFYVDEYDGEEAADAMDCGLLHVHDIIVCTACNKTWSGRALAKVLVEKNRQVPCPHCHGTGFIPKEQVDV